MTELRIAPDLSLPLDAVTEAFGIVGVRGSGKSFTAKVLTEELTKARLPVTVMDPLGVWWGLRSSADGERPGLPFVIFGGDHADVPLDQNAGEVIADFVIAERVPTVLDLSLMRKAEMRRFATAFLSRLYHRNRQPLHLVVDEADLFAPQRVDDPTLLGAMEDLVRRGRAKGLGCTLITQRPAVIAKDVLTQISTLIAMRLAGPQDRKALDEWVRANGTAEQRDELLGSLASLPTGTAWVWSPHWLGIFQRVAVRRLETFDSSATPKSGEALITPRAFADVDLDALRGRITATIEKAKADDPKELRKRIAELERELKSRPTERRVETVTERVEVPVLDDYERDLLRLLGERLDAAAVAVAQVREQVMPLLARVQEPAMVAVSPSDTRRPAEIAPPLKYDTGHTAQRPRPGTAARVEHAQGSLAPLVTTHDAQTISRPQQRILDALASLETLGVREASRSNVAVYADASPTSSAFGNNLGRLSTMALIRYPRPGFVTLTDEGRALASADGAAVSLDELHDAWCRKLSGPQGRILRALIEVYPDSVARDRLAESANASPTSSAYGNNLGHLRSLGLLDYSSPGWVVAASLLFPEGLS